MRLLLLLSAVALSAPSAARGAAELDWPAPAAARVTETVSIDGSPAWVVESLLQVSADTVEGAPVLRVGLGNSRFTHLGGAAVTDGRDMVGTWATQPKWIAARADGALVYGGVMDAMVRWGAVWDAQGVDRKGPAGRGMVAAHFAVAVSDSEERWREFAGLWRPAPVVGEQASREVRVFDFEGPTPAVATVRRLADEAGHERLQARYAWTSSSAVPALAMGAEAMTSLERVRPGHWLMTQALFPVRVEVQVDAWLDPATRRPLALVSRRSLSAEIDGAPRRAVFERRVDLAWRDGAEAAQIPSADDRPFIEHAEPPVRDGRRDPYFRLTRIPYYPPALYRTGVGGTVMLRARVGADGRPLDVEVESSSGHPELDRMGAATLREWRFWPEVKDGAAVEGRVVVPLNFQPQVPTGP
jgi:TonB family protein